MNPCNNTICSKVENRYFLISKNVVKGEKGSAKVVFFGRKKPVKQKFYRFFSKIYLPTYLDSKSN